MTLALDLDGNSVAALATVISIILAVVWLLCRGTKNSTKRGSFGTPDVVQGAPDHPHLQGSMFNDPPKSLTESFMCPGDNATQPWTFDNSNASGLFLPLHIPTYTNAKDKWLNYPYAWHFEHRKRLWEMRYQFRFKHKISNSSVLFGIELDEFVPMDAATTRLMKTTVAVLRTAVGDQLYHSKGDDPKKVSGELERPVFTMPMWAFDQIIVTPEGEEPPDLTQDISKLGFHRTQRVKEFIKEVSSLELKPGPTFTFCFWGISRWLDNQNWTLKQVVPLMGDIDFNRFCGRPPVHMVFYQLDDRSDETRHLDSRKNYLARFTFWSSKSLPPPHVLRKFVPEDRLVSEDRSHNTVQRPKSSSGGVFSGLECCTSREK